jgi:hypothetical protein
VAIVAALFAGCHAPAHHRVSFRLSPAELMMWSSYLIGTESGTAGTGIVVRRRTPANGGVALAVVTAGHLLESAGTGTMFIALRVPDHEGNPRAALLQFDPRRRHGRFYVKHPRHDVAAFALTLPPAAARAISLPTCLEAAEVGRANPALHAGDEVFFAGFPDVMPFMEGVFPLLRSGRVASYPVGTPAVNDLFYIDADTYAGDSGAPVFPVSGRRPRLAGMIVERVKSGPRGISHFAVAVHARAIRETLDLLEASESSVPARSSPSE